MAIEKNEYLSRNPQEIAKLFSPDLDSGLKAGEKKRNHIPTVLKNIVNIIGVEAKRIFTAIAHPSAGLLSNEKILNYLISQKVADTKIYNEILPKVSVNNDMYRSVQARTSLVSSSALKIRAATVAAEPAREFGALGKPKDGFEGTRQVLALATAIDSFLETPSYSSNELQKFQNAIVKWSDNTVAMMTEQHAALFKEHKKATEAQQPAVEKKAASQIIDEEAIHDMLSELETDLKAREPGEARDAILESISDAKVNIGLTLVAIDDDAKAFLASYRAFKSSLDGLSGHQPNTVKAIKGGIQLLTKAVEGYAGQQHVRGADRQKLIAALSDWGKTALEALKHEKEEGGEENYEPLAKFESALLVNLEESLGKLGDKVEHREVRDVLSEIRSNIETEARSVIRHLDYNKNAANANFEGHFNTFLSHNEPKTLEEIEDGLIDLSNAIASYLNLIGEDSGQEAKLGFAIQSWAVHTAGVMSKQREEISKALEKAQTPETKGMLLKRAAELAKQESGILALFAHSYERVAQEYFPSEELKAVLYGACLEIQKEREALAALKPPAKPGAVSSAVHRAMSAVRNNPFKAFMVLASLGIIPAGVNRAFGGTSAEVVPNGLRNQTGMNVTGWNATGTNATGSFEQTPVSVFGDPEVYERTQRLILEGRDASDALRRQGLGNVTLPDIGQGNISGNVTLEDLPTYEDIEDLVLNATAPIPSEAEAPPVNVSTRTSPASSPTSSAQESAELDNIYKELLTMSKLELAEGNVAEAMKAYSKQWSFSKVVFYEPAIELFSIINNSPETSSVHKEAFNLLKKVDGITGLGLLHQMMTDRSNDVSFAMLKFYGTEYAKKTPMSFQGSPSLEDEVLHRLELIFRGHLTYVPEQREDLWHTYFPNRPIPKDFGTRQFKMNNVIG